MLSLALLTALAAADDGALSITTEAVVVLVRLAPEASKAEADASLEAAMKSLGLPPGALRAGRFSTAKGRFLALHPAPAMKATSLRPVLRLAEVLSLQPRVKEAWVTLHPGAAESKLELELCVHFEHGAQTQRAVDRRREHPEFAQWLKGDLSEEAFAVARGAQAGFPLTALVKELALPGRWFLEVPQALMWLGGEAVPTDAGEDLERVELSVPAALVVELKVEAAAAHSSPSALAVQALEPLAKTPSVDDESEGAPGSAEAEGAQRALVLFLPRARLAPVSAVANRRGESLGVTLARAWRVMHPAQVKKK
jgi:hypothetical protein